MIGFELTEDHLSVERLVRDFVSKEIAPYVGENDANHYFDRSILSKLAKIGLLGICIPPQYGGAGFDYISLGVACEELEYGDTSLRVIMSVHVALNSLTLLAWGTEDQKQRYLTPQAQGTLIASYALTEPGAGSDARGIQTVAERRGDAWVLNGEKMW